MWEKRRKTKTRKKKRRRRRKRMKAADDSMECDAFWPREWPKK